MLDVVSHKEFVILADCPNVDALLNHDDSMKVQVHAFLFQAFLFYLIIMNFLPIFSIIIG
jgi:hypothetical protein